MNESLKGRVASVALSYFFIVASKKNI